MNTLTRPFLILAVLVFLCACEPVCDCEQQRDTVIVPSGTYFLKPHISENECISRDLDFIERTPDKFDPNGSILEPIAFLTYEGVLHRTVICPHAEDGTGVQEIALVELNDGRLVWIDTKKLLQDTTH